MSNKKVINGWNKPSFHRSVRDLVDCDYKDQLTTEQQDWLSEVLLDHYGAKASESSSVNNKRLCYLRNHRARRDYFNNISRFVQSDNLGDIDLMDTLAIQPSFEQAVIFKDLKTKKLKR